MSTASDSISRVSQIHASGRDDLLPGVLPTDPEPKSVAKNIRMKPAIESFAEFFNKQGWSYNQASDKPVIHTGFTGDNGSTSAKPPPTARDIALSCPGG